MTTLDRPLQTNIAATAAAGAIAMAEVELKYGDDEESKAMAQKIIDAQGPEIEEMTAWVEENAGQQ